MKVTIQGHEIETNNIKNMGHIEIDGVTHTAINFKNGEQVIVTEDYEQILEKLKGE